MDGGDILLFNPTTEFTVVEEFEFDELIRRPEQLRFFTLTEQTTDFLEKLLPKGKVTKGALRKAEHEVDSFKKLYANLLIETADGFDETSSARPTKLPWVTYTSTKTEQTAFSWAQRWSPLFEDDQGYQANYYLRMLDSLPKNAFYFPDGVPAVYDAIVNGHKVLGPYKYTKTGYREDGTFRVQMIPRPDTQDVANFSGYTIGVPEPPPPAPLADHPFLGLRTEPINIETTEDLPTILPSIEAIFQHAVPRTQKPEEALPYLKLYDIKLSQVPWNVWKDTFPPAELVEESAPPIELPMPVEKADAPSKVLLDVYRNIWMPGMATRKWLSLQLDGGALIARMLLSQAGALGPIAIPPPVVLPDMIPIEGTAEDCLPIADFDDFANTGVYRAQRCSVCGWAGHGATDCPDLKKMPKTEYKPGGGCLPLAMIVKEREEAPFVGKEAWVPGTDASILQSYQALIATYTEKYVEIIPAVPVADASAPTSETRELIVAILKDETQVSEDKAIDIRVLLDDTEHTLVRHQYREEGQFLLCEHTLDQLDGAFEKDPQTFLKTWTVVDSGFRICQFCGERISNVLEAQDEFDEHGRLVQMRSKIQKPTFNPDEHVTFASSLKEVQALLKPEDPAEDIIFLLLSLLQVLPDQEQLKPILAYIRAESGKIASKTAGKKLTTKQKSDIDLALAVFGFNGMVVLLQSHRPQLLPRRSFGSKPLILRGFPRDTDDAADAPLIDSLLGALTQTFENYPTTFRGSSVVMLRTLLNDKKGVKKIIVSSMTKQFVPVFKKRLMDARDLVEAVDVAYAAVSAFQPPIVRPAKEVVFLAPADTVRTTPETRFRCLPAPPWMAPSLPFSFRQEELTIVDPIKPSTKAVAIVPPPPFIDSYRPSLDEIRRRIKKKAPDFPPLKRILAIDSYETLQTILLEWISILQIPALRDLRVQIERSAGNASELRDYYKGCLIEVVSAALEDPTLPPKLERSLTELTVRSVLTKAEDAKKSIDTLRAREREEFKARMRRLPDALRETTKLLIDKGIAPYLITKDDRESMLSQLQSELETIDMRAGEEAPQADVPDEGFNAERDIGAQGEVPEVDGIELEADYGDYGDRRARDAEGEEVAMAARYDDNEGMGF